jgi:hypothetical protein
VGSAISCRVLRGRRLNAQKGGRPSMVMRPACPPLWLQCRSAQHGRGGRRDPVVVRGAGGGDVCQPVRNDQPLWAGRLPAVRRVFAVSVDVGFGCGDQPGRAVLFGADVVLGPASSQSRLSSPSWRCSCSASGGRDPPARPLPSTPPPATGIVVNANPATRSRSTVERTLPPRSGRSARCTDVIVSLVRSSRGMAETCRVKGSISGVLDPDIHA